jgi:hypothetical protein
MSLVIDRALQGLEQLVGDDADCEVHWTSDGGVCGKPAVWIITGHSGDSHTYVPSRTCDACLNRMKARGFTSPFIKCGDCGVTPLVKDIRPI